MHSPSEFDIWKALDVSSVYDPPERFLEAFYAFASRLSSLQRYFEFSSQYVNYYLAESRTSLQNIEGLVEDQIAEFEDLHGDITLSDEEYFAEYLRASVVSHLFTLIEGLFSEVADDIGDVLDQTVELPSKAMPYINRYVTYLQRGCGLSLNIDKEAWKSIDAIRDIRNRLVHRISRDLPDQIQGTLQELFEFDQGPSSR